MIPDNIRGLSKLGHLDLSFNHFAGVIPREIGSFSELIYLNLSENILEGELPTELGDLANLEWLDLSNNRLEGRLPSSLGKFALPRRTGSHEQPVHRCDIRGARRATSQLLAAIAKPLYGMYARAVLEPRFWARFRE